jgi:hypothetical protein
MLQVYFGAMLRRVDRHDDPALRAFIRSYPWKALFKGKMRAVEEIEAAHLKDWIG